MDVAAWLTVGKQTHEKFIIASHYISLEGKKVIKRGENSLRVFADKTRIVAQRLCQQRLLIFERQAHQLAYLVMYLTTAPQLEALGKGVNHLRGSVIFVAVPSKHLSFKAVEQRLDVGALLFSRELLDAWYDVVDALL